jgi:prepilin-type N-terminal cleavage/methylation domain-containing protein
MKCYPQKIRSYPSGFTLVETVIALFIAGLAITALIGGYVWLVRGADSAAYAMAANGLALQRYEQTRAAKFDATSYPIVDELTSTNFPPQVNVLDMNVSGTRIVYATNFTTISTISTNPFLKAVRVDCVYTFPRSGIYTSSIVSYRGSDTGQQNSQQSAAPAVSNTPPSNGTVTVINTSNNTVVNRFRNWRWRW